MLYKYCYMAIDFTKFCGNSDEYFVPLPPFYQTVVHNMGLN